MLRSQCLRWSLCAGALLLCAARAGGQSPGDSTWGPYTPMRGFKVANTDHGDLNIRVYTYVRYLNQLGLDSTYTDAFGNTTPVKRRQDVQFQKVVLYFYGWIMDPKFKYMTYVWTANTSQGQTAQVVVGGNLTYKFHEAFTLAGGINALPGVRSTEGSFPLWLSSDNRMVADEFFRPSYTMGIWARGKIDCVSYALMLGNNLSQLGVDAGQLDNKFDTWSGVVSWLPTTGEFGTAESFGDFDHHARLATRVGAHYTRGTENFQGQANTDAFENVQIRLSDGNVIFKPDLFGPGIRILDARYHMGTTDIGLKYRGVSLEAEHYWRKIDHFDGPGTAAVPQLWDHGFQALTSAMAVPKKAQVYVAGSKVYGQYGDPWDARAGASWYPFANQVVRWNAEYLRLHRCPVGALSLPYTVGANGYVLYTSLEVNF